jgi:hypothetical protein
MLGAQARAAELAAASAAKQRQVSRELEERQLPPKPSVSLSAFTKSQPAATRNKGSKAWKPLTLDDIAESSDSTSISDHATSTPSNADRLTSKEASDKKIPTAPRSMVAGRSLSTVIAHAQLPKVHPTPVINMPAIPTPQGYGPTPGGFPYPVFSNVMYSYQPMVTAGTPFNDASHFRRFGSMMVLDDISPTKQEQKLSMIENMPHPNPMHGRDMSYYPAPHHPFMQHDDPFSHGRPQTYGHSQQYAWNGPSHDTYFPEYEMPFHGHSEQYGGSYEESGGSYPPMPTVHVHQPSMPPRSTPTPSRLSSAANQPTILPVRRASGQQSTCESPLRYQEPYDTKKAMEDCVNKLKEKARDGKTVLHNPEVQNQVKMQEPEQSVPTRAVVRIPSAKTNVPVPWAVQPKDTISNTSQWEVMPPPADQNLNVGGRCSNVAEGDKQSHVKPAPGLPIPSNFNTSQWEGLTLGSNGSVAPGAVGSAEWMRLAPMTSAERENVRRCMARAAKSVTNGVPENNITSDEDKEDLLETQKWFYTDARGERLLRDEVGLSAQAHASKVIANIKARNGGELPESFQNGKDDGLAATLILGNVACNLQTYLVGDRKSNEQRKNFHKVKSVPDWCTERGGLGPVGLGGGDSYFDGATGGFHGAPVRVARDPRFRPQVKEGMKVKPEEEWKNRHEMYGRRVV